MIFICSMGAFKGLLPTNFEAVDQFGVGTQKFVPEKQISF
jgi:hypothetical protein